MGLPLGVAGSPLHILLVMPEGTAMSGGYAFAAQKKSTALPSLLSKRTATGLLKRTLFPERLTPVKNAGYVPGYNPAPRNSNTPKPGHTVPAGIVKLTFG